MTVKSPGSNLTRPPDPITNHGCVDAAPGLRGSATRFGRKNNADRSEDLRLWKSLRSWTTMKI